MPSELPWAEETFAGKARFGLKVKQTLLHEKSEFQTVHIVDTEMFGRALLLDGVYQTSEGDEHYYHEMLVHPAMVCARDIKRVLVIGGGDGGSVREVLRYPEVELVVLVELDRLVVEASQKHLAKIGTAWDDPRLEVRCEDGIAFMQGEGQRFDVILIDGPDPVGPAEGLFQNAFYEAARRRLAPGGMFASQSESPVYMEDDFYRIVRTLRDAFPSADPYFASVPVYASALWSYTLASELPARPEPNEARQKHIEQTTRYYNREIHRAAFAMPNEVKRRLAAD